jgi:hypothetical protein
VDSHDHEENENDSIENEDDVIDAAGEEEEGSFLNDQQPSESNNNARTQDESESSNTNNEGVQSFVARTTMTLAELEEEVRTTLSIRVVLSGQGHDSLDNCFTFSFGTTAGSGPTALIGMFPIRSLRSISHVDLCGGQFRYVKIVATKGTFAASFILD